MADDMAKSVEIVAIGSGDFSQGMASLVRFGSVRFTDFKSFVNNVIAKAGNNPISLLTVICHGSDQSLFFGEDEVTNYNFQESQGGFLRLSESLAPGSRIEFRNCEIGNNTSLLQLIADATGASIRAHTGASWSAFAIPTGAEVNIDPSERGLHKVDEWNQRSTTA